MDTKLVAYAPAGGQATLIARLETISVGAQHLTAGEMEDLRRARLIAAPANDGTLADAKGYLETRGWTCYWDGPPGAAVQDARFEVRLTQTDRDWVRAHGGGPLLRNLVQQARARHGADGTTGEDTP